MAGWLEQKDRGWIPGVGQECRWGSSDPWSHLEKTAAFQRSVTALHRHPALERWLKDLPFLGHGEDKELISLEGPGIR